MLPKQAVPVPPKVAPSPAPSICTGTGQRTRRKRNCVVRLGCDGPPLVVVRDVTSSDFSESGGVRRAMLPLAMIVKPNQVTVVATSIATANIIILNLGPSAEPLAL